MDIEDARITPRTAVSLAAGQTEKRVRCALRRLVSTTDAVWPTILRMTLGTVMLPHALQKTLGLFGGHGLSKTMEAFTAQLHLPAPLAALAIFLEQASAVALLVGVFTRAAALGVGAVMVGAIVTVHAGNGFFMNWSGMQAGEGFEYHLLVLAMVAALVVGGGGRASLDQSLSDEPRDPNATPTVPEL